MAPTGASKVGSPTGPGRAEIPLGVICVSISGVKDVSLIFWH